MVTPRPLTPPGDGDPSLGDRSTNGNRSCPLAFANCSIAAAAVFSSRFTIWYGFFTAVVSFRRMVLANRFYRTGSPPPLNLQLKLGHPRSYGANDYDRTARHEG